MRVLKAYADAGAMGQPHQQMPLRAPEGAKPRPSATPSKSGDVINISDEARELMRDQEMGGISVTPQDATYDQRGHIMRQFDTLQGELRSLASQIMGAGENPAMLGSLHGMQSRVASLRAQV